MDSLGIDVDASDSDNMKTLQRMKNETGEFTEQEAVVWLQILGKIGKCQGLVDRAEEYAHRLVVEDERNQGWLWLREPEEFWGFMKPAHRAVLERFGMDRGIVHLPVLETPIGRPRKEPFTVYTWSGIVLK